MKLIGNTNFHRKALYARNTRNTANFMLPSLGGMPGLESLDNFSPESMQGAREHLSSIGQGVSNAAARAQEYLQKFGTEQHSIPKATGTSYHGTPFSPFQQFDRIPPNGGSRIAPTPPTPPSFDLPFGHVPDPVQPYGISTQRLPDVVGQPQAAPSLLDRIKQLSGNKKIVGLAAADVGALGAEAALIANLRQPTQVGSLAENIQKAKTAMTGNTARNVGLAAGSAAALGAGGAYVANQFNISTAYMADFGFKPIMPAKLGKVKLNLAKSGNLASSNSKLRKRASDALSTVKQAGRDTNTRMPVRGRSY